MNFATTEEFIEKQAFSLSKGPVCILFLEDPTEILSTVQHFRRIGFDTIIAIGQTRNEIPPEITNDIYHIDDILTGNSSVAHHLNLLIPALNNRWIYYGYNAEYYFYPFLENRTIHDLIAFSEEERRHSIFSMTLDIYAQDISKDPNGISLSTSMFDTCGYYKLERQVDDEIQDREFELFGGLRWRFSEFVPENRRRIDRVPLFKSKEGLKIDDELLFNDSEYNTVSSPWHRNVTGAVCSFRVAKALLFNPNSYDAIESFEWVGSESFKWDSKQLLDHGIIESAQWF